MLEDDSEAISGTKRRSHVMACGESTDHTRDAHTHIHKTKLKLSPSSQANRSLQHAAQSTCFPNVTPPLKASEGTSVYIMWRYDAKIERDDSIEYT